MANEKTYLLFPLFNLRVEGDVMPAREGEVCLRKISGEEREKLAKIMPQNAQYLQKLQMAIEFAPPRAAGKDVLDEVVQREVRQEYTVWLDVLDFALSSYFRQANYFERPYLKFGMLVSEGGYFYFPKRKARRGMAACVLEGKNVGEFLQHLKKTATCCQKEYARIAVRRYMNAREQEFEDGIIDAVIALEALVGDISSPAFGSLSYKVAMRTSVLVEEKLERRKEMFGLLRGIYDWRSNLVHGSGDANRKAREKIKAKYGADYPEKLLGAIETLLLIAIEKDADDLGKVADEEMLG